MEKDWTRFHGFPMERTDPESGVARLLVSPRPGTPPARDREGRPAWYWDVHFWGAFPGVALALLERGWHVAHTTVDELYGGPECMRRMDGLFDALVSRGFSRRPALVGMSRGGLDAVNWALHRPDAAGALVLDNPVLDLRSWPFGRGASRGPFPAGWAAAKRAYGFRDDAEALAWPGEPLLCAAEPLARAGTPVLLLQSLADTLVPPEENGLPFLRALRAAGAAPACIEKPGMDHHPHGLEQPDPVVAFLERAIF